MTQEEKNLLLRDLGTRIGTNTKLSIDSMNGLYSLHLIGETMITVKHISSSKLYYFPIEEVKLYLRPMSSMTEEEIYEYNKLVELDRSDKETFNNLRIEYIQNHPEYKNMPCVPMYRHIDYLNTYHFDYRGLIPMGLAIPAPEGMYNTK